METGELTKKEEALTQPSGRNDRSLSLRSSVSSEADRGPEEEEAYEYRVWYLTVNLAVAAVFWVVCLLVYSWTNSLTMAMDFVGLTTEIVGDLVNIGVEYAKYRTTDMRTILLLDLGGALVSIIMLLGYAVFGVIMAIYRSEHPSAADSQIEPGKSMMAYAVFAVAFSWFSFFFLLDQYRSLGLTSERMVDRLNVLSNMMHTVTDSVATVIIWCTAYFVTFTGVELPEKRRRVLEVREDVVGASLILGIAMISVLFLISEAVVTVRTLMQLESPVPAVEEGLAAQEGRSYGSMDMVAVAG